MKLKYLRDAYSKEKALYCDGDSQKHVFLLLKRPYSCAWASNFSSPRDIKAKKSIKQAEKDSIDKPTAFFLFFFLFLFFFQLLASELHFDASNPARY